MQLAVMIIQLRPSVMIDHSYANSEDPYLETESEIVTVKAVPFFPASSKRHKGYSYKKI